MDYIHSICDIGKRHEKASAGCNLNGFEDASVTVVIVNWNSGNQLRSCVDSVIMYGANLDVRIVVVDNGSVDDSERMVEDLKDVTLVRAGVNLGFGKACNLGARNSQSDYLLFLNPDAALYAETLPKALTYMQDPVHAKVGVCGVQLIDESGHISRSCARFPSSVGFVAHAIGLDRAFPRLGHFMTEWDHSRTRQVDHVIGAFFLVRRAVFRSLNGFDEQFFVYLEDLDFSSRAGQSGWQSVYLADAQAFHAGGGTSNQIKARRLFYSLRSRLLFSLKHFSRIGAISVIFFTVTVEPFTRSLQAILRCSLSKLKETWLAYAMLIFWLLQKIWKFISTKFKLIANVS